ncbi:hypothetical protein E2C01_080664 [Portunus trituberculatus]|uniref:Uncharacterized protein n=1 Tax=Portunus trituberculatus TaxID=210409 RepID=A0A5B7ITT9_PORTR|nr:hypothetical protein [Portunus trituberculatus]
MKPPPFSPSIWPFRSPTVTRSCVALMVVLTQASWGRHAGLAQVPRLTSDWINLGFVGRTQRRGTRGTTPTIP